MRNPMTTLSTLAATLGLLGGCGAPDQSERRPPAPEQLEGEQSALTAAAPIEVLVDIVSVIDFNTGQTLTGQSGTFYHVIANHTIDVTAVVGAVGVGVLTEGRLDVQLCDSPCKSWHTVAQLTLNAQGEATEGLSVGVNGTRGVRFKYIPAHGFKRATSIEIFLVNP